MTMQRQVQVFSSPLTIADFDTPYNTVGKIKAKIDATGLDEWATWATVTVKAQEARQWGAGNVDYPDYNEILQFYVVDGDEVPNMEIEFGLVDAHDYAHKVMRRMNLRSISDLGRTPTTDTASSVGTSDRRRGLLFPQMGSPALQADKLIIRGKRRQAAATTLVTAGDVYITIPSTLTVGLAA